MGPFSNNKLSIVAANAGALGLMSTSSLHDSTKNDQYKIYEPLGQIAGADPKADKKEILMVPSCHPMVAEDFSRSTMRSPLGYRRVS